MCIPTSSEVPPTESPSLASTSPIIPSSPRFKVYAGKKYIQIDRPTAAIGKAMDRAEATKKKKKKQANDGFFVITPFNHQTLTTRIFFINLQQQHH
jgi:hypothetical protein